MANRVAEKNPKLSKKVVKKKKKSVSQLFHSETSCVHKDFAVLPSLGCLEYSVLISHMTFQFPHLNSI